MHEFETNMAGSSGSGCGPEPRNEPDLEALRAALEQIKRQTREHLDLIDAALERTRKRIDAEQMRGKSADEKHQ